MLITNARDERVKQTILDLVVANKILTVESVLDAYGHVSARHPTDPDRFLMSEDSPPVLVSADRIVEYGLDGEVHDDDPVPSYLERYIHAAVYAARPDVHAICHNHTLEILPFCAVPAVTLRIVSHTASILGRPPALWDIADDFGPDTDLMVTDLGRGASMAQALGSGSAVLMRSHGSTVVGRDIRQMVVRTHELVRNARVLIDASRLAGEVVTVRDSEIHRNLALTASSNYGRQWRYFEWRVAHEGV